MSEKVIVARRIIPCDLCGQLIQPGKTCRMVRDDYMPFITYFEHIHCPTEAVDEKITTNHKPL